MPNPPAVREDGAVSGTRLVAEIYACSWTGRSQVSLARFRTWIDSHTDQLIVAGS